MDLFQDNDLPMGLATFSDCERYRYDLVRLWDRALPKVCFVMLNPSTADHRQDDPTVRKCTRFAERWGYGQLAVVNLFAWRSTDPTALAKVAEPVGRPENDEAIIKHALEADEVVCAWGNYGALHKRGFTVATLLKDLNPVCLGRNQEGQGEPKHPLYLPYTTQRVPLQGDA